MREYLTWPTDLLHPVPEGFSDATVAMLEPLGVALHCLDLGHVHLGNSVAVVGCGPIGLMLIQALRVAGASRVVAVEPLEHRRRAAARAGAELVLARPRPLNTTARSTFLSKWPAPMTPWPSACSW